MQDDVEEDEEEVVIMIVFEHDQNFLIGFFFTSCSAENIEYHVHNLDYFVSNFNVHFHVFPQRVCPQRCRDTLAAFVSFFSTLHFPHIA